MAEDKILRTYGDVSIKEDVVLNAIEILTARETQIFNMLGKTKAISTVHNYLTDTLASAASSAVAETGDYTPGTLTTPTRLTNLVEIVARPFKVSRTQQQVEHYQGENELQRQTRKELLNWGNAAEFDLLRSTLTSGASGTTPKMDGIINAVSTNASNCVTTHTSTTAWSASILDGLMKTNWENSNGDVATELFLSGDLKKATDDFTQKTNIVVNNPGGQTRIVKTVTTYETSFGTLNIRKHRYIYQSGTDAHDRVLAIRPDKLKIAFLKKPFVDTDLARSGDYDFRAIVGKFTLELRNPTSCWFADGFKA